MRWPFVSRGHFNDVVAQLEARLAEVTGERDRLWGVMTAKPEPAPERYAVPPEAETETPNEPLSRYGASRRPSVVSRNITMARGAEYNKSAAERGVAKFVADARKEAEARVAAANRNVPMAGGKA